MAEQYPQDHHADTPRSINSSHAGEAKDGCGCFDFNKEKEIGDNHKAQEDVFMASQEDINAANGRSPGVEKHVTLMDVLQGTHSHLSFSSEEDEYEVEVEEEEGGERKRKKKKGLKEAIKEKISSGSCVDKAGGEGEDEKEHKDDRRTNIAAAEEEEEKKKGFLEKIKEKLHHGGHEHHDNINNNDKEGEDADAKAKDKGSSGTTPPGILDMIKEQLPAGHHKSDGIIK